MGKKRDEHDLMSVRAEELRLKNAIGYIRISTEAQGAEDKYGIEVQRRAILEYANAHGYGIVEWKIEQCSGASDKRPMLDMILYDQKCANPPYSALIVFKNDRLARDTKLYFYYLFVLERKGIKVLSCEEHFAEGDVMANAYRSMMQFAAEQERRNIALRTKKGREIKAMYGGYSGGTVPYGYYLEDGRLVINEREKKIVEAVFIMNERGFSMRKTAAGLANLGYKTRKGGQFGVSGIRSILENRKLYEGYYRYGDHMDWVKGVHEPILVMPDEE